MVSRYNPVTGRKQKVRADSPEAAEWSGRKIKTRTTAGVLHRGLSVYGSAGGAAAAGYVGQSLAKKIGTRVERRLLHKAGHALDSAVMRPAVSGVTKFGPVAAGLIAAGLVSYGLTKEAVYHGGRDQMRDELTRNVHKLREALKRELGRELTPAEVKKIYGAYVTQLARLTSIDPQARLRAGAE